MKHPQIFVFKREAIFVLELEAKNMVETSGTWK
jgi:hypothetical protein